MTIATSLSDARRRTLATNRVVDVLPVALITAVAIAPRVELTTAVPPLLPYEHYIRAEALVTLSGVVFILHLILLGASIGLVRRVRVVARGSARASTAATAERTGGPTDSGPVRGVESAVVGEPGSP
jgi:hypothetical protein